MFSFFEKKVQAETSVVKLPESKVSDFFKYRLEDINSEVLFRNTDTTLEFAKLIKNAITTTFNSRQYDDCNTMRLFFNQFVDLVREKTWKELDFE